MSEFRAATWWIDRWRKSTAYTDMTLAEQGAYRNLLDELWLRDGILPADERILAKIAGDAREWRKVREAVLRRFVLTKDGYRNLTHDEIAASAKAFRESQAEKGRKGAAARWGKDGPATDKGMAGPVADGMAGLVAGAEAGPMAQGMASGLRTPESESGLRSPGSGSTATQSHRARTGKRPARREGDPRIDSLKTAWLSLYRTAAGEEPAWFGHGAFGRMCSVALKAHDEHDVLHRANAFFGSERGRMQGWRFEAFFKDIALYGANGSRQLPAWAEKLPGGDPE